MQNLGQKGSFGDSRLWIETPAEVSGECFGLKEDCYLSNDDDDDDGGAGGDDFGNTSEYRGTVKVYIKTDI